MSFSTRVPLFDSRPTVNRGSHEVTAVTGTFQIRADHGDKLLLDPGTGQYQVKLPSGTLPDSHFQITNRSTSAQSLLQVHGASGSIQEVPMGASAEFYLNSAYDWKLSRYNMMVDSVVESLAVVGTERGFMHDPTPGTSGSVIYSSFDNDDSLFFHRVLSTDVDTNEPIRLVLHWYHNGNEAGKTVGWQVDYALETSGSQYDQKDPTIVTSSCPATAGEAQHETITVPASYISGSHGTTVHFKISRTATLDDPATEPRLTHVCYVYSIR